MQIITLEQAKKIDFDRASVALGTFDGLHLGHMALINAATKHEGDTIAFTFDALPVDVFKKKHKPMQLFTLEEKETAFEKTGIDYLCVKHFDKEFADIDKHDFVKMMVETFSPKNVIAGYNYTYGRRAEGTAKGLIIDSKEFGYNVEVIQKVIVDGIPVSSTKIRDYIWDGNIESANKLLGYEYSMCGNVIKGKMIGKSLGFPTANLEIPREKIMPKSGVYSGEAEIEGNTYNAVCNIGIKPTVTDEAALTLEVHLLGFNADIYGKQLRVSFRKRIRDEVCFESKKQLSDQIKEDIASVGFV